MPIRKLSQWMKKWSDYVARTDSERNVKRRKHTPRLEELEPRIVLDADWYVVPGSPLEQVNVTFKRTTGSTPYKNELGYYIVSDDAGRVEGVLPSDPGYAAAVNRNSKTLFSTSSKTGATSRLTVAGGTKLGFYLVQNSTSTNWKTKNPDNSLGIKPVMFLSFDGANPDGVDHVLSTTVGSETRYRWEDRTNLADRDFNDMVYSITAERPKTFTPGEVGQLTPTTFTLSSLDQGFKSELGIFMVDDAKGTVNGIAPGQPGYTKAALTASTSQVLFARGTKKGASLTVDLSAGQYFGLYLVQNTTTSRFLETNPNNKKLSGKSNVFFSIQSANPDKANHVQWSSKKAGTVGFEDLWGGGDNDFNDLVASFKFGTPYTPVNPDNTAPNISEITSHTIPINSVLGPIAFAIDDEETPADQLIVTAASTNTSLLPLSNIQFGGSGSNRTITLQPVAGQTGTVTVIVTVTDPNGNSSFKEFILTVAEGTPFPSDLGGWTIAERGGSSGSRGTVSISNGQAVMVEGDSFLTTLSRSFTIPQNPSNLLFQYASLGFDSSSVGFIRDAFEVALLDGAGNPLTATIAPGRDAFFNISESTSVQQANGVTLNSQMVSVDISSVPVGTVATLVFRLVNNDADTTSTVTLGSTILPTTSTAEGPVKFFVVDGASSKTHRYGEEGIGSGSFDGAGSTLRGAASNPVGDKVWLIDSVTRRVSTFGATGSLLASWVATDAASPQGLSVHNGDLWLVDRSNLKVLSYEGGMLRTTDASSTDFFTLDAANTSPSDLVTDGSTVWVTDDALAEVFVYDVSGVFLGRWKLDSDNVAPSGITRNPAGGTDLWVVDRTNRAVYHYPTGANTRDGQLTAVGTFLLGLGNSLPEGIADPPPNSASPPTISVSSTTVGGQAPQETTILISGQAVAFPGHGTSSLNQIADININGIPVDALDPTGAFFAQVEVRPGENVYHIIATDMLGQQASTDLTVFGSRRSPDRIDISQLLDVSATFRAEYAHTSFQATSKLLYTDIAIRNLGEYPAGVPLYVGVKNISDPAVQILNATGTLADGTPYYDFTGLVTGGATQLAPNAATGTSSLAFSNPNRTRFTYDLVFLVVPNRAPNFSTIPELEAMVNREYLYDANATDSDGDLLTFTLLSGPTGMAVDPLLGIITWTPNASQVGNFSASVQVSDGRGGTATQDFTIVSVTSRPIRPPVITTLPVVDVKLGEVYAYDVDAADPDRDNLTYRLDEFPAGMSIDSVTGLITWSPTASRLGHAPVTVTVNDGQGGIATQSFEVCVEAGNNRPPIIVSKPVTSTQMLVDYDVAVVGNSNPWLAGMPSGSIIDGGDIAPRESPTYFPLMISAGDVLAFDAHGAVENGPRPGGPGPDGGVFLPHAAGSVNGISGVVAPLNSLMGVFLGPDQPYSTDAPSPLDFTSTGNVLGGVNYRTLSPLLQQVFFIGDGKTSEGLIQQIVAPNGATRLYLGTMDGTEWSNNTGVFNVSVGIDGESKFLYDVEALDPDGTQLTYTLTQPPPGMIIQPSTGVILWSAASNLAGLTFPVTVRVDDGRGGSDEQHFNVTVPDDEVEREFDPVVEWHKDTFTVLPDFKQVSVTPSVFDMNDDGTPDIVFVASSNTAGWTTPNAVLRAISGSDGSELWSVSDPAYRLTDYSGIAIGDLDNDSRAEVVAIDGSGKLIVFENDGTFKWRTNFVVPGNNFLFGGVGLGSPSIADLDGDGTPEIILGSVVVNADGSLRWDGTKVAGTGRADNGHGPLSAVADLDGDGIPEVLAGKTAFRADGSVLWTANVPDGFPAVGNFDSDTGPELALVAEGNVYLLDTNGTVIWGPNAIPGGGRGGAPTIADFDNDGMPEIGVAGANRYVVFETDGSVRWQSPTQDGSSNVTGSSVFDFDGDGSAEVVYGDEVHLLIFSGRDGTVRYQLPKSSATGYEYPVIADVDGDGSAEIIAVANTTAGYGPHSGIYVIGDRNNTWVNARPLWNQHTYHITNINDDGTIPTHEVNSWDIHNTYRLNVHTSVSDYDTANYAPKQTRPLTALEATAPVRTPYKLTLPVIDPDGDDITYEVLMGPEGLMVHQSLGVVAWYPLRDQIGTHQVVIRATDSFGNATPVSLTLTVPVPNTAPVFTTEPPTDAVTVDRLFEYHAFAQDAEQTNLVYSLINPAPGMAISQNGVLTWTPTDSTPVTVTIRVSDGELTTDQVFTLNVASIVVNTNPTLTVEAPSLAWLGRTYVARLLGSDAEGDAVRYELVNGPIGMTVDAVTGILNWIPNATGAETIRVKAIDGQGGETEAEFVVAITNEASNNHAPVIVSNPTDTAQTGVAYAYDLVARDPDGGPVVWSLVSGPQGMSLDSERGTIRWNPADDQSGTFIVTVRVMDQMAAFGEQTFTIHVSCSNAPPVISSRPPTVAYANEQYIYAVRATDPENDPLIFTLESAPDGMSFIAGTSLIRWNPTTAQAGSHEIVIRVIDQVGNETTQAFTLLVSTETPNKPPVITSRPTLGATLDRVYRYSAIASDPDGDSLTYELTNAPDGMIINSSGRITWTPTEPTQALVTVQITDSRGGVAVQSFTVTARANQAPVVNSIPNATAALLGTFRVVVRATDPEGDDLIYSLIIAPTGMSIDGEGRITWIPTGNPRNEQIVVQVADTAGLATTTEFTLTLILDTEAPRVNLTLSRTSIQFGTAVQIYVSATDNIGIGSLRLTVTHEGVTSELPLNATRTATFTPSVQGRYTFTATATDTTGNAAQATAELFARDPNAQSDVRASFTRLEMLIAPGQYQTFMPTNDTGDAAPDLSYLTDVYGTVESVGLSLAYWRLLMAKASDVDLLNPDMNNSAWKELGQGREIVTNQKLGVFDPTLLSNEGYVLALEAYDVSGGGWVQPTVVNVVGNAKLGDFRLEFTDLTLPLNGIPITISRVYDSKTASISGDFGYGWSLGVRDAQIRETVGADNKFIPGRTKVYLTAPDGNRVGFTYNEVDPQGSWFGTIWHARFTADPGQNYKLTIPDDQVGRGGILGGLTGEGINPSYYLLTMPDGSVYEYEQSEGLKKITDSNGNKVVFTATAITHSGGRVITLERDGVGRITAIRLPEGNVAVRYRYNSVGDLVEVKQVTENEPVEQALTSSIRYRTDRAHYLDEYIDANGNKAVKTNYDASGRLIGVTDANGIPTRQEFDLANFKETIFDALRNPTTITYNDRGNVTKTVQPTEFGDIVLEYEYVDPNNPDKETKIINGRGYATTRSFDVSGNLLSETTPDGTTRYQYNAMNKVTQVADTMGRVTAYGYDVAGNLIRVATPNGESSSFTYDDQGRVKEFKDFKGYITTFRDYCSCGRPLTIINPDLSVRTFETNQYSQITKTIDEVGHTTENEYDNQGRLVAVKTYLTTGGMPQITRYEYTGTNQTKVIDPLGNLTRYEYDKLNRRTKIIDAEGGITSFGYDENGNQTTVTDSVGNVTTFVYDKANRVKEEKDPLGNSKFFKYDGAGNQIEITDRIGRVRQFEYDPMNRQTEERWLGAEGTTIRTITSQYDNAGNLLRTADPDAELTYTYDSMNRMKTATTVYPGTNVAPVTLFYGYDANGNVTSVKDNTDVEVASTYDNRNRLEIRNWSGGDIAAASVKYTYFRNSQAETLTRFSDTTQTNKVGSTSYEYWHNGLTKKITHRNSADAVLVNYDYLYNDAGLLRQDTHHGKTYVYGYDKTGQLLTSTINGTLSESFTYDKNGNRKTSTGFNGNQTYQTGLGNQLKNDGKFSYVYDKEGNLSSKTELATGKVTTYTWDQSNRLTKVGERTSGGVVLSTSEYAYDPTGRRIVQKVNGQVLYTKYNGNHAWVDASGDGEVHARFIYGNRIDDILAIWQPARGSIWHLKDKLGTVHDLADSTGSIKNHIVYSAYGTINSSTSPVHETRYLYVGRELNSGVAGDYYYRNRVYSSTSGRFVTPDPSGFLFHDFNLYEYVRNAPSNATDPFGLVAMLEYTILEKDDEAVVYTSGSQSFGTLNDIPIQIINRTTGEKIGTTTFGNISKDITIEKYWKYAEYGLDALIPGEWNVPWMAELVITYVRAALGLFR